MSGPGQVGFDLAASRLPTERLSPAVRRRHRQLFAAEAAATVPTRRRPLVVILAAAAALGGAGVVTAGSLGLIWRDPPDRTTAVCFATAELSATDNFFEFAVATPTDGPAVDAVDEGVEICTGAWQQGRLSEDPPTARLTPGPKPWDQLVPTLIGCVLPDGRLGIFPGTVATCEKLGLDLALT